MYRSALAPSPSSWGGSLKEAVQHELTGTVGVASGPEFNAVHPGNGGARVIHAPRLQSVIAPFRSLVDQIGYETSEAFLLRHEAGHCRRGSSGRSYADQFAINTIRQFDGALGDKKAAAVLIWRKVERDPGHRTANFIDKPDVLARLDRVSRPVLLASSME
jgi:hypothetical protein